jgi:hypothetical protein
MRTLKSEIAKGFEPRRGKAHRGGKAMLFQKGIADEVL